MMNIYMIFEVDEVPFGTLLATRLNERARAGWEPKTIMPNANGYEVVFQKLAGEMPTWDRIAAEPEMG